MTNKIENKNLGNRPTATTTAARSSSSSTPNLGNAFVKPLADGTIQARVVMNLKNLKYYEQSGLPFPVAGDPDYDPKIPVPIPLKVIGTQAIDDDGNIWIYWSVEENGTTVNKWISPNKDMADKVKAYEQQGALSSNAAVYSAGRIQKFTFNNDSDVLMFSPDLAYSNNNLYYTLEKQNQDGTFTYVAGLNGLPGDPLFVAFQEMIFVEGSTDKKYPGPGKIIEDLEHGTFYYLSIFDATYQSTITREAFQAVSAINLAGVGVPNNYVTGLYLDSIRNTENSNEVRFYLHETNLWAALKAIVFGIYSDMSQMLPIDQSPNFSVDGIENINTDAITDATNPAQTFTLLYNVGGGLPPIAQVISAVVIENNVANPVTVTPVCFIEGDPLTPQALICLKLYSLYDDFYERNISGSPIENMNSPLYGFVFNTDKKRYEATSEKIGLGEETIGIDITVGTSTALNHQDFKISTLLNSKEVFTSESPQGNALIEVPNIKYMIVNTVTHMMTFENTTGESLAINNTYVKDGVDFTPTHFEVFNAETDKSYSSSLPVSLSSAGNFSFVVPTDSPLNAFTPLKVYFYKIITDSNNNIISKQTTGSDYWVVKIAGSGTRSASK